jgi:outer membrane biogenesis lipoprotein LolB
MKSISAIVVVLVVLGMLSACARWAERPLIGHYHLVHPTGCRDDIQDSTLVVHDDGTFDQSVQLKSGRNETVENGHWTYDRAARRINFSKFLVSTATSFSTETSHPAVIYVNRSGDCWYQHPK